MSLKENNSKLIRVTIDAYNSLDHLKKRIGMDKLTYSDIINVSTAIADVFFEKDPLLVKSLANAARVLRLRKKRGDEVNILQSLVEEYRNKILEATDSKVAKKIIVDAIELLLDEGHIEAATSLLFEYKSLLDNEQFKELSTKILERQVQLRGKVK